MRDLFFGWQCALRRHSVRGVGGRPSPGMVPLVSAEDGEALGRITVVITRRQPEETTTQFSYIVRQTQDPVERYEKGLKILQADYYGRPEDFSDEPTALFGARSTIADRLLAAGSCVLDFEQDGQRYRLPCAVEKLSPESKAYQATYWHNHLFNPKMPPAPQVLAFRPDWSRASALPPGPGTSFGVPRP